MNTVMCGFKWATIAVAAFYLVFCEMCISKWWLVLIFVVFFYIGFGVRATINYFSSGDADTTDIYE